MPVTFFVTSEDAFDAEQSRDHAICKSRLLHVPHACRLNVEPLSDPVSMTALVLELMGGGPSCAEPLFVAPRKPPPMDFSPDLGVVAKARPLRNTRFAF